MRTRLLKRKSVNWSVQSANYPSPAHVFRDLQEPEARLLPYCLCVISESWYGVLGYTFLKGLSLEIPRDSS